MGASIPLCEQLGRTHPSTPNPLILTTVVFLRRAEHSGGGGGVGGTKPSLRRPALHKSLWPWPWIHLSSHYTFCIVSFECWHSIQSIQTFLTYLCIEQKNLVLHFTNSRLYGNSRSPGGNGGINEAASNEGSPSPSNCPFPQ